MKKIIFIIAIIAISSCKQSVSTTDVQTTDTTLTKVDTLKVLTDTLSVDSLKK